MAACSTPHQQIDSKITTRVAWTWQLPPGFPAPDVPDDNPMSAEKVELGRHLFYEQRLSVNGNGSCASCHQQRLAFTDGRANAIGVTGERHVRSAMTLVNVAYNTNYTWASRKTQTLEQQIPIPLFNTQPVELGLLGRDEMLVETLASDSRYQRLFKEAFGDTENPVNIDNIVKALASFVRSIIAADSAFDRRLFKDEQGAMSISAVRGMRLFFSSELNCSTCHSGRLLVGGQKVDQGAQPDTDDVPEYFNTGLYNVGGRDLYPGVDSGLRIETKNSTDDGRFVAPTLRNIALTAPYMHDGSIATLPEVLDHYAAGGRRIRDGNYSGDGSENANKSPLVKGFELSSENKADLLAFLDSLTDYSVTRDLRIGPPDSDN